MTHSEYASEITRIIDEQTGHSVEYPDSFESDVEACFVRRMSVEDAAEHLYNEWFEDSAEQKITARDAGWAAGKAGRPASDNPHPISVAGHKLWKEAWELSQRD